MADMSLDEFIRKGNVKVNIRNTQVKRGKLGKLQQKSIATNNKGGIQGLPKKFDARYRLGPKVITDARDKIVINKKSGVGDARNKIVQKQVQKGTFDARSLLQRQARKLRGKVKGSPENFIVNPSPAGLADSLPLRRTLSNPGVQGKGQLSNPGVQGKGQVRATNSGLLITRPTPKTDVSLLSGGSIQVPNRSKSLEGSLANAIPIIQIRNDRYRQPGQTSLSPQNQPTQHYSHSSSRQPSYPDYSLSSHSHTTYSSHLGVYRDYDDPQYNEASIATPEIPKINISNVRPVEVAVMKPVTYIKEYTQTRVPPGAATVSQGAKQPVIKTVAQPSKLVPAGVKRRPAQDVSGPLRLGRGGGPGIDLGTSDSSLSKKLKVAAVADMDIIDVDSGAEVISPLQGFRVMVTNLYSGVTQDDIIELFGAVGPLKKAKLLKPGSAEVVYVSKEDAVSAVQKYHSRELDGQPMYVKMTTPVAAVVKKAVGDNDPDITGEALRLYKKVGMGSLPETPIEIPTIHRALFKAGPSGPSKSVKFTVKI